MILNYTTKIEPEQTIAEIQKMLSKYNVSAVMTEYDGPQVAALSFRIMVGGTPMAFRLPCNWRAVRKVFNEQRITISHFKHKDRSLDNQAVRTSWRVIKDWIEAQLALVEINMVTVPQVFLPYAIRSDGKTVAEKFAEGPHFLLGSGKNE